MGTVAAFDGTVAAFVGHSGCVSWAQWLRLMAQWLRLMGTVAAIDGFIFSLFVTPIHFEHQPTLHCGYCILIAGPTGCQNTQTVPASDSFYSDLLLRQ